MADINAYLREAINGPAPQHKVAGRNQFEISEGSDGATHTKIVDVDGNPLSSIPVNVEFPTDYPDGAVKAELELIKAQQAQILERMNSTFDTQLTGSNVVDGILVKQTNGVIPIQEKLGTIPGNGSKFVRVKFLEETGLINNISLVGRNSTNKPIEIDIREGYLQSSDHWNTSQSFKDIVFPESSNTAILTERQPTLSQTIYIYVTNKSDTDIELLSLGVMLWG